MLATLWIHNVGGLYEHILGRYTTILGTQWINKLGIYKNIYWEDI